MKKEVYKNIQDGRYMDLIGQEELPAFLVSKCFEYEGVKIQYLDLEYSIKQIIHEFIKNNPSELDKAIQVISYVANCTEGYSDLEIARQCCVNKLRKTVIKRKYLTRTLYGYVVLAPLFIDGLLKGSSLKEVVESNISFIPKTRDCVSPVKVISYKQRTATTELLDIKTSAPLDVYLLSFLKKWDIDVMMSQIDRKVPINWHFLTRYYMDTCQYDNFMGLISKIRKSGAEKDANVNVSFGINDLSKMFEFVYLEYDKTNDAEKKDIYCEILEYFLKGIIQKVFKHDVDNGKMALASCHNLDHNHFHRVHLSYISEVAYQFFIKNPNRIVENIKFPLLNWSIFFENIGIKDVSQLSLINDFKDNKIKQAIPDSFSRFNFWTTEPTLDLFSDTNLKNSFYQALSHSKKYDESFVDFVFLMKKIIPKLDQQLLIPYINKNFAFSVISEMSSQMWLHLRNQHSSAILGLIQIFNTYNHKKILRMLLNTSANNNIFLDTLTIFSTLYTEEYPDQSSFSSINDLHEVLKIIQLKKNTQVKNLNQQEIIFLDEKMVTFGNEKFKIKVPKTNYDLIIAGEKLNNCVGIYNYTDKIIYKNSFVFLVEKDQAVFACVEIVPVLKLEEQDVDGYYVQFSDISSKSKDYLFSCYSVVQSVLWGNKSWDLLTRDSYLKIDKDIFKILKRKDLL